MWLQDTGILIKLRDSELNAPNVIPLQKVKFNEPLTISQLATSFIFATIGLSLSVAMFLKEIVIGRKIMFKDMKKSTTQSKSVRGRRVGQRANRRQMQIVS